MADGKHTTLPCRLCFVHSMIACQEVLVTRSQVKVRVESKDENNACLANQLLLAAADNEDLTQVDYSYTDVCNVEHHHLYCLSPENDHTPKRLFENLEPEKVKSVGCQTDITTSDFEKLENELKNLKNRLVDKKKH